MSLDFDLRQITDKEEKQKTNPYLDGLIWATMYVGIPRLTEKNLLQFYSRIKLYDQTMGEIWSRTNDDEGNLQRNFPTFDQVRDFIGLKTNATPYTNPQFFTRLKKMLENSYNEIMRGVEREARRK
jgi:hypothetical protein